MGEPRRYVLPHLAMNIRASSHMTSKHIVLLAATAVLAAAIGDPLVETIANSGAVGRGYNDSDHMSVIPALIVAGLLISVALLARCIHAWRASTSGPHLHGSSARTREMTSRSIVLDAPIVYSIQLFALFVMENFEQLLSNGRFTTATAWLGGPMWFSLLFHAILCIACLGLLRWSTRVLAGKVVSILRDALQVIHAFQKDETTYARRANPSHWLCRLDPCVRRTRGRAPPYRPAFV